MEDSLRKQVQDKVAEIVGEHGYQRARGLQDAAEQAATWSAPERLQLNLEGATRLYGEVERRRKGGLRQGYAVHRRNGTISLALLDHTFPEAQAAVEREVSHAKGAQDRAAWDLYLLDIATQRCIDGGQDPELTELTLRHFVDEQEIDAIYAEWRGKAA